MRQIIATPTLQSRGSAGIAHTHTHTLVFQTCPGDVLLRLERCGQRCRQPVQRSRVRPGRRPGGGWLWRGFARHGEHVRFVQGALP